MGENMINIYKSKNVTELVPYYRPNVVRLSRKHPEKKLDKAKQLSNKRMGIRRFARILNSNFSNDDYFVSLTYGDRFFDELAEKENTGIDVAAIMNKPIAKMTEDEKIFYTIIYNAAKREMNNYLHRLERKIGHKVAYAGVTANLQKKKDHGEPARIHHHIIIKADGMSGKDIQSVWQNGDVYCKHLSDKDYTYLTLYLMTQVGPITPRQHKLQTSKGLKKPIIETLSQESPLQEYTTTEAEVLEARTDAFGEANYLRYYSEGEQPAE